MVVKIKCDKTKSGLPSMEEEVIINKDNITGILIADRNGKSKKAIYIPKKISSSTSKQAYFVINKNDLRIEIVRKGFDRDIKIFKIKQFDDSNWTVELELIEHYNNNNLDDYQRSSFRKVINVAMKKVFMDPPYSALYYKENH